MLELESATSTSRIIMLEQDLVGYWIQRSYISSKVSRYDINSSPLCVESQNRR